MAQARGEWDGHRKKSSKVYWVMGRMAGSSATSDRRGRARASLQRAGERAIAKLLLGVRDRRPRRAGARAARAA